MYDKDDEGSEMLMSKVQSKLSKSIQQSKDRVAQRASHIAHPVKYSRLTRHHIQAETFKQLKNGTFYSPYGTPGQAFKATGNQFKKLPKGTQYGATIIFTLVLVSIVVGFIWAM